VDVADLAQAAYRVGREGHPLARLVDQLDARLRGRHVDLEPSLQAEALDGSLLPMARAVERPVRDASVAPGPDGSVLFTSAQSGLAVDVPASRHQIARALAEGRASVDLVLRDVAPSVTDDRVQPARDELERLLGGDEPLLTLTTSDAGRWPLARATVAGLLAVERGAQPDEPYRVEFDARRLRLFVQQLAGEVDQEVQDARFAWDDGRLTPIHESQEGRTLDQEAAVALIAAKLQAGERTAELPVRLQGPVISSREPEKLGIVELIEQGSTSFAGSTPEKQHNIRLATERLNGVVVPPGATFSFNEQLGPTTLDAGFTWGFGITTGSDGTKTVPSVAGGICQVATTLFHSVFWAGFPLEERFSHFYWIPAYTSRDVVGLDVTVDADTNLDFKWTNPTDSFILIQAEADQGRVYFSLYGKKPAWTVKVEQPKIANRTPPDPTPVTQEEPNLAWGRQLQVESAREGFDVVVTRTVVSQDGGAPRVLSLRSSYQPSRNVTLVGTAGKPAEAPTAQAGSNV
jgi:vancomycin resistance protein YoaR